MDSAPLDTFSQTSLSSHDVRLVEHDWTVLPVSVPVLECDGLTIYPTQSIDVGRWCAFAAKRLMDVVGAAIGLCLLAPVMLALVALIRIDSPGPVLFRQRRLGRYGRSFWILKFRTMRADAERLLFQLEVRNEAAQGILFKMNDDPRVTRLGRFLRRTNLDELPQLWNVLIGEMSLVGPRPFQLRDCERLRAIDAQAFAMRLQFPPGLTGAWQVGRRSPTDSEHLLDFDLDYVGNWSLARDVQMIYRTFFILLAGFFRRD
jgi:lipopolysaccharide/colanic/teichoic acid biosynthesis glycosyltransferase